MPGPYVVAADTTPTLRNASHWVSYNRIADPFLFALTGQWAAVAEYGAHFMYNETSRALIFARNASDVVDEASLRALIRYNNFLVDPLSVQGCADGVPSGSNAIAERGDLTSPDADCIPDVSFQDEGAIDAKYTTAAMVASRSLASMAQSGPTYDQVPAFNWANTTLTGLSHIGQPTVWAFPWVPMAWDPSGGVPPTFA